MDDEIDSKSANEGAVCKEALISLLHQITKNIFKCEHTMK